MREAGPAVSVIIPTYNRAHLLGRAIHSVLAQSLADFELIVVDDASEDRTNAVVEGYRDHRIRYLRHTENRGASAARNTGINAAQGEYICLLDSDDEWLETKLEEQMAMFEAVPTRVGVIYAGFSLIWSETGEVVSRRLPSARGNVFPRLLEGNILGSPTPMIRRRAFNEVGGFDEQLPSCQDWDMWIRLSKLYQFDYVPQILASVHVHEGQISTDLRSKIQGRQKLLAKYRDSLSKYPSILGSHFRDIGRLHHLDGDVAQGRKYLLQALKTAPYHTRNLLHVLLSVLAPRTYRLVLERRQQSIRGVTVYR